MRVVSLVMGISFMMSKDPVFFSLNNLAYDGYCVWSGRQVNDTVQEECFDWTPVTL